MSNVATVSKIKEASKAMLDALDDQSPVDKQFRLQVGITLQPQGNLSLDEVKTAIRKYHQAVSNFDESLQAAMVFDLAVEDAVLQAIFKKAQESITPAIGETVQSEAQAIKA
jgi:ribosomal protein S20